MDRIRDLFRFDEEKEENDGYVDIDLDLVEPPKLNLLKHSDEFGLFSFGKKENFKVGETSMESTKQKM
jgi:hypothetical protein